MYKLTLEPCEEFEVVFKPKRSNQTQKIFMEDTYWYPQRIKGKRFISLNISSADTLKRFVPLALPEGNIFGEFPINDNEVCYVYSGSLTGNRVSASLGLRPFFVSNDTLFYFFPDEDFKTICHDVGMKVRKVVENSSGSVSIMDENLRKLRKILTTPIAANLGLYARFFELYCEDKCKAHLSYVNVDSQRYCTAKVGLHPLLHIVELIPSRAWTKERHRNLFVYLLQQDFLVDWVDITELDETRRIRILSGIKRITPEITRFNFKIRVNNMIKNLVNKCDIFTICYFLSRYEGGAATLKKLFDNLFYVLPEETEAYLSYPKFQPKLFIDGFEMHFILSGNIAKIYQMEMDLWEIFDEVASFGVGISEPKPHLRRYRFVCKAKRERQYIDYMDFPDILDGTCNAIITLVNQNELQFVKQQSRLKESWLKRINLRIVTPPQFETATLEAFGKSWILHRKVSKDIEMVHLFTIGDSDDRFGKNMDKGIIPEELKMGLEAKDFSLTKNACVEKEKDNRWRITDAKNIFVARKKDDLVDIYVKIKAKIVSADILTDYVCLVDQVAKFNFFRDVQSNFTALNRRLEEEFNFKMFG